MVLVHSVKILDAIIVTPMILNNLNVENAIILDIIVINAMILNLMKFYNLSYGVHIL